MKIPEVVVFDLGKVLVDFDYGIMARNFARHCKMVPEEIQKFIDHSPLLFRYETGSITKKEFFETVCAETGFCGALDEFSTIFSDIFSPMDSMIELHQQLRQRKIPTYIFSNTNELAIAHIRKTFPFFQNFTDYVFSYEHGAMKPQAKLYEVVERVTGKSGEEILYIDDRMENIEAGKIRGWQTIVQENPTKTIELVKKSGVLNQSP